MNTIRPCGCKGVRTCLQCEKEFDIQKPSLKEQLEELNVWIYCQKCESIFPDSNTQQDNDDNEQHSHNEPGIPFPGVYVKNNFLLADEGKQLMEDLDTLPWDISQSGRRKQNFGPKTNFKKQKLRNGNFKGFPAFSEFVQKRFEDEDILRGFQTIEQCSLEYDSMKGACIDPHVDDCWIWGERVVTVNCLGDSVLSLIPYDESKQPNKYNLDLVNQYEKQLIYPKLNAKELKQFSGKVIRIMMPNLSLIVLYGPARYQFEHLILREDIKERRVCVAYREFTPMYIDGDKSHLGDVVRENAKLFWNSNTIDNENKAVI